MSKEEVKHLLDEEKVIDVTYDISIIFNSIETFTKTLNTRLRQITSLRSSYEYMSKGLKEMNIALQIGARQNGEKLNKLCKRINPSFEEIIVGHQHRAAGVFCYKINSDGKVFVLLVEEPIKKPIFKKGVIESKTPIEIEVKKMTIPGGKAQGEEYPLITALREFGEETGILIDKENLRKLPHQSIYYEKGMYTLFFISAITLGISIDIELYKGK